MNPLQQVDDHLWTLSGNPITFLGYPFEVRSTFVDLGGEVFVHSPIQFSVAAPILSSLPPVKHIVSPNKLHHLFLTEWAAAIPKARLYAPPGLSRKRRDLRFATQLGDAPEPEWSAKLDQRVVRGSFFMDEVVFFHRASRTLIVGDLIENHDQRPLTGFQRRLARWNAVAAPNGSTARNYRWTFWKRDVARRAVREILSWQPQRIIVAHGPCIEENAPEFLRAAFAWLL